MLSWQSKLLGVAKKYLWQPNNMVFHVQHYSLYKHLADDDALSLPRNFFHEVFNGVWSEMCAKRGLMVDAFAHCGLYPLKNTGKETEYLRAKSFTPEIPPIVQAVDSNMSLLKTIVASLNKKSNPTHSKRTVAHVTSPDNAGSKKQKVTTSKSKPVTTSKSKQGHSIQINCLFVI